MKVSNYFIISLVLFGFIIFSCASVQSVSEGITIESGVIPPEMAKEKFTLIGVMHGRKSYDKYLKSGFEQNYFGDYVLMELKLVDEKYPDKAKYRYLLDYNTRVTPYTYHNGKSLVTTSTTAYIYYIEDRLTGKKYTRSNGSSFFAKEIQAMTKAIERTRFK